MPILDPPSELIPLPPQPEGVPWPTDEWPTRPLPAIVDPGALDALLGSALGETPDPEFGETHAVLVVHGGRLVLERYGPGIDASTPLISWSMAKSITHALVGILVAEGRLDPDAPAAVAEWTDPGDPRRRITLQQMLRMVDGLEFNETYTIPEHGEAAPWSHCIDMLFGAGKADPAAYAAARPPAHPPGTVFNYSSGTANLVARIVGDTVTATDRATVGTSASGTRAETLRAWMHERLFSPIGMTSAEPTFDESGNFIGSSYVHATGRDWARFGLLHLRGGEWDGTQVVPRSWVDDGRTPRARDDEGNLYGAHWWIQPDGRGRFQASGYGLQRVICLPAADLVVVRLGHTAEDDYDTVKDWIDRLVDLFDPPGSIPPGDPGGSPRSNRDR